ncbi:hypothetical protein U27_00246 [Candidatus Vecturithrix granuli]|uniref:HD domain-containing protein n=1 Tax=Vecturithrix granuli TaxID=1499967 RepID=A0A081C700_VECG1|nr:hypothetical protein U27_00246 [Candidatus Vecturithrix granuli]
MSGNLTTRLFQALQQQYALPLHGIHGISHWARVYENGCRIAEKTRVNLKIVQLFALFHDSKRQNEGADPEHGIRGAKYAATFHQAALLDLSDQEFDLLYRACADHTDGLIEADITVQACWDADRLDLYRVGILPDPALLCTNAAKSPELREWANTRAALRMLPDSMRTLWSIA